MSIQDKHLTVQDLVLSIDNELPSRRRGQVDAHLAQCLVCRDRRAQLAGVADELTTIYQEVAVPDPERMRTARTRLLLSMNDAAHESNGPIARVLSGLVPAVRWAMAGAAVAAFALLVRAESPRLFQATSVRASAELDALPVAALTPGATWDVSLGDVCSGAAHEQRPVRDAIRQKVLRDYRMEAVPYTEYELDYLITPELGGAPEARNLWPQRYASRVWNARTKDQLEQLLPRLVCAREVTLVDAQRDIARDWIAAYKKYFHTNMPLPAQAGRSFDDDIDAPALTLVALHGETKY